MVNPALLFALSMWTRPPEATCSERSQLSPSAYKLAAPYTVVGAASAVALSCRLPSWTFRGALKPEPTKSPCKRKVPAPSLRSEEHTSELQSRGHLVCRLRLEKKKNLSTRHSEA